MEIWMMRTDRRLTERERLRLTELLPPERRARLEQLRVEEKREQVLWAYGLLALALRERCGLDGLPAVALEEGGKPCFPHRPDLHFSLSHTKGAVLAALADAPVGVDVECLRPVSRKLMEQLDAATPEEFFSCWVRREARGKRSGGGIGPMLRRESPMAPEEFYFPLETFPGYAAGAAGTACEEAPKVHLRTPEDLQILI